MTSQDTHLHEQHGQWQAEHALWTRDIDAWQLEHLNAIALLPKLEELLGQQAKALEHHAESIRRHQNAIEAHEIEIARHERGGRDDGCDAMNARHDGENMEHAEQRTLHQRLGQRHHEVMALMGKLIESLRDA